MTIQVFFLGCLNVLGGGGGGYICACSPLPRFDVGINYYYYYVEPRRRGTYLPKIMRCTYSVWIFGLCQHPTVCTANHKVA